MGCLVFWGTHMPGLCAGIFLQISFPHLENRALAFYGNYHVYPILPDLSESGSMVLVSPMQSMRFLTSFLHLSCAVLIFGSQDKDVCPRKVLPLPPHRPLLQPHPVLSHNMLLPTIPGCYYQQSLVSFRTIQLSQCLKHAH